MHDIDLPCPVRSEHVLGRPSFFNPLLDGDDTRVSEIMKFRRCRSNARWSDDLSSSTHLQRHVFRPFLPHRRSRFSFFPTFFFLRSFISRCKIYASYAVKCTASAEYTSRWYHFWKMLVTRISIKSKRQCPIVIDKYKSICRGCQNKCQFPIL